MLVFQVWTSGKPDLVLLDLEGDVVVIADTILIAPKLSQERSIGPFFSLVLPNCVVNVLHDLVGDSLLNARIANSFPELGNEVRITLETVVDCCLLKAVNDPLEVRWRDVDLFLLELLDLCLGRFIILNFEGPVLFDGVLEFRVHWLSILDIVGWHFLTWAKLIKLAIFEEFLWILEFHVGPVIRIFDLWLTTLLGLFVNRQVFNLGHRWCSLVLWRMSCSLRCDTCHYFILNLKFVFTVILRHGDVAITLTTRVCSDSLSYGWLFFVPFISVVRVRDENIRVGENLERFDCAFLLTVIEIIAKISKFLEILIYLPLHLTCISTAVVTFLSDDG